MLHVTLAATIVALATPVDVAERDQQLRKMQRALPKTVGENIYDEQPLFEAAIKLADLVLTEFEDVSGPRPEALKANARALKEDASAALAAVHVHVIIKAINEQHASGALADDGLYAALEKEVGDFAERGTRWQSVYLWLVAHRRATMEAKLQIENALRLEDAFKAANLAHRTLERALLDEVGRVARERLVELDTRANALAALDERAATWYRDERLRLAVEDAWRIPVPADRDITVASLLRAEIVDSGGTRGKRLKKSFKLPAGHCAGVLFRFQKSLVGEGLSEVRFESRAKKVLRRFSQVTSGAGWQRTAGVCTSVDDTITVRANVERGERGNVLDFIIVDWAADQDLSAPLPSFTVHLEDRCDDALIRELWLKPVRGSLVFNGKEPGLLSAIEDDHVVVIDITGERKRVEIASLGAAAPLAFSTPFTFKSCGPGIAQSRDAKNFTACVERVFARYEKKLAAAGDDRASLVVARDAEEAQRCGAMKKRIETKLRVNYDRILDESAQNTSFPVDRGAQLKARARARTDLR